MKDAPPFEDRFALVAGYYQVPLAQIRELAAVPHAARKALCESQDLNPHVLRTMLDYTRYSGALMLQRMLKILQVQLAELTVLDFGCLVSDYGMHFARLGAQVTIYDYVEETRFAAYRYQRENLPVTVRNVPTGYDVLMEGMDLVVFGEVLEHLDDPLAPLQACAQAQSTFLFTSCYPFGWDGYFDMQGHSKSAQHLQPACLDLLRARYDEILLRKRARLWVLRD